MTTKIEPQAVDLSRVADEAEKHRQAAAAEQRVKEEAAIQEAQEYVERWHKAMNKTFKGISGGSSLDRRFRLRAQGKKIDRERAAA